MQLNECQFRVLVKGRPVTEFPHRGQVFIEGRGGSNYELEFSNRNPFRVEAIFSVDGLSVRDGKAASPASSGYLVEPFGTVRVPGWTLDHTAVAAFAFAGERGASYVEQVTGSPENKGVLGVLVHRENRPERVLRPTAGSFGAGHFTTDSDPLSRGILRGASAVGQAMVSDGPAEQTLGTAFGDRARFNTVEVSFNRGDMLGVLELFYDDLRGLRARGVPVDRPQYYAGRPQAFPGLHTGCRPPAGWQG